MAHRWAPATKHPAGVEADHAEREGKGAPIDPELDDLRKDLAEQVEATRALLEHGRQLEKERRAPPLPVRPLARRPPSPSK